MCTNDCSCSSLASQLVVTTLDWSVVIVTTMQEAPRTATVENGKTLYNIIPQTEAMNVMQSQLLTGDPGKSYIGLREDVNQAFDRRRKLQADVQAEDCIVCAVRFSPLGWLLCTTTMLGTIPMLTKKLYYDGMEWGVWHLNAAMPTEIREATTDEVLVSVTFHPLKSYH